MKQIIPCDELRGYPCSIVAVSCALGRIIIPDDIEFGADGYLTLSKLNKLVRRFLPVKKRVDHRRGERPLLKDLTFDGKAVVCVYGHFIYVDKDKYYSFFNNENDEVVAIWYLKDEL